MQSVKVGWAGQTFALAKCSDSGGKKPRSRKTREERRNMVESFIKKYRKSNSGNFPSLNLTHKEVGGSFYTIREIVREIIQENKVLRPAGFPPKEQYTSGTGSESHQSPLSLSSAIGSSVDEQPAEIFKEEQGKPEELVRASGEGSFNGTYDIMEPKGSERGKSDAVESKDSEMGKSYQQDSSIPQFIRGTVMAHQQQNMHSNGDVVVESFLKEERRKQLNTEQIETEKDTLAHKEVSEEKIDVAEHAVESVADAVASKLPISEDVLSENKEDSSTSKTKHLPELVKKSLADKSHEIDQASDGIDLQKASVVVDATSSELVVPDNMHDTKIVADISENEYLPDLVCKSVADESHEIGKASDRIDLQKTLVEVDATASEVVVPGDTHDTKIISDISETKHLPELVHKSLADEPCEIDKASDSIDLQKTAVEVDAAASAAVVPNDAHEANFSTQREIGNGYIQTQEEPKLVCKSLADESHEIDGASDSIDLQNTLGEVDATASKVVVPDDMHDTKTTKGISKTEHLPELVHKLLADEPYEIEKACDSIDLQKSSLEVVATASEGVVPNDAHETKIRTDIETGNECIQTQEESSTDYVREAFSSASSSNVTFGQNRVSEVVQTSIANPSSEGLDFHRNTTNLTSGVPVLELNSALKDADVDVPQNDSVMLQSCNQPSRATKVEPVLVSDDAQAQKTATTNSGMSPREKTDITPAAAVITREADLKHDSRIRNETSNEMTSPSLAKENKKSEETFTFLAAIKAFFDAFVKFWVDDL